MRRLRSLLSLVVALGGYRWCRASVTPQMTAPLAALEDALTGDAKKSYEAGRVLAGADDFANAYERFKTAYQLSKDPRLLWNMAAMQKSLHSYGKAYALTRRYVTDAGSHLGAEERQEAENVMRALELVSAKLHITASQADARVSIDGFFVGTTPLGFPLALDPGHHKLLVEKDGLRAFATELDVRGQESLSANVVLQANDAKWPACAQTTATWLPSGKLVVAARSGAKTVVDGETLGAGHVECVLPAGEHEVVVSTAALTVYRSTMTFAPASVVAVQGKGMLSTMAESAETGTPTVTSANASWVETKEHPQGCGCQTPGLAQLDTRTTFALLGSLVLLSARRARRHPQRSSR